MHILPILSTFGWLKSKEALKEKELWVTVSFPFLLCLYFLHKWSVASKVTCLVTCLESHWTLMDQWSARILWSRGFMNATCELCRKETCILYVPLLTMILLHSHITLHIQNRSLMIKLKISRRQKQHIKTKREFFWTWGTANLAPLAQKLSDWFISVLLMTK